MLTKLDSRPDSAALTTKASVHLGDNGQYFMKLVAAASMVTGLAACGADNVQVKVGVDQLRSAIAGNNEIVPFSAKFSMSSNMDDKEKSELSALEASAKKYLSIDNFEILKSSFGVDITVEGSIPVVFGEMSAGAQKSAWALSVNKTNLPSIDNAFAYSVQLVTTGVFGAMQKEMEDVSFMLSPNAVQPVSYRIRADTEAPVQILAGGFYVDGVSQMISVIEIPAGESKTISFKGGAYESTSGGFLIAP